MLHNSLVQKVLFSENSKRLLFLILLALVFSCAACSKLIYGPKPLSQEKIQKLGVSEAALQIKRPFILVDKSDGKLYYVSGEDSFRMPVATGKEAGAKLKQGDNKTPVGVYYFCDEGRPSCEKDDNYYFFGFSYPNIGDAEKGLETGLIKEDKFNEIKSSIEARECPRWNTGMGGAIGIHGKDRYKIFGKDRNIKWIYDCSVFPLWDYSRGCIMTKNYNIDFLKEKIKLGMDLVVRE